MSKRWISKLIETAEIVQPAMPWSKSDWAANCRKRALERNDA